jgi:hypothetical protein
LHAEAKVQQAALVKAKTTLASPAVVVATPKSVAEYRLGAFYTALAPTSDAEQQIKTIFAIASHQNLQLNLADYKMAANADGLYQSYQLQFPLSGSYAAIRQFWLSLATRPRQTRLPSLSRVRRHQQAP